MVRLIAKIINEERETEYKKICYSIEINDIDDYKFRRWLDLMNSYDDSRKSTNNFNELLKEIQTDYDKDFKSEDLW